MNHMLKMLTATAVMAFGTSAHAAVIELAYTNGNPVVDTDGVTGLADIDWFSNSTLSLDIQLRALGGAPTGSEFEFTVSLVDFSEVNNISSVLLGSGMSIDTASTDEIEYIWQPTGTEVVGDTLATFMFETIDLGLRPHDDLADINLTITSILGQGAELKIFDPISGLDADVVSYDVQAIPLPASIFRNRPVWAACTTTL